MSESTWQSSPVSDTVDSLQKAIAGYVLMPTDEEVLDCAAQGIKRAIDRLNTRQWNWMLWNRTITFVAGTQEYEIPSGLKSPRNFSLRDSGGIDKGRLMFQPWGTFLKEANYEGSSIGGNPCYYSAVNVTTYGLVRLDVAPSSGFVAQYPTGQLWYYRRIQYPTSTGNTLGTIPSEITPFVVATGEAYAADRYAPDKSRPAYERAERFLQDLIRDDCHNQQSDWE